MRSAAGRCAVEVQAELDRMMLAEQRVRAGLVDGQFEVRARMRDVDGVVRGRGVERCRGRHHRGRLGEGAHRGLDRGLERRRRGRGQRQHDDVEVLVRVAFVVMAVLVIMVMIVVVIVTMLVRMMIVLAGGLE